MQCESLQEKSDKLQTAIYKAIHQDHEQPSRQVLSNAWQIRDEAISCVASQPVITAAFNLNGGWTYDGKPEPSIYIHGNFVTIAMSAPGLFGEKTRPSAFGILLDPHTILVNFPDDGEFKGTLNLPHTIAWSNHSTWTKA